MIRPGISFIKSKLARRFLLLFILCAFVPTVALIVISYNQVIRQLEEQSYIRLKREVTAYSLSLYDRLIRIDNDLNSIGRVIALSRPEPQLLHQQYSGSFEELFNGLIVYNKGGFSQPLYGSLDKNTVKKFLNKSVLTSRKPFIISAPRTHMETSFFFGVNIFRPEAEPFTVIADVKPEYIWGFGASPILPPMTELSVYDKTGKNIIASMNGHNGYYQEIDKRPVSADLQVFEFTHNGQVFHAGISNIFLESRFQDVGWTIILSRARNDIMSAMDKFKQTFPMIILFFLLIISYLSLLFIRKGLDPLQRLQQGTKRIAQKDFSTPVEINSGDEFEDLGNSFNDMASKLDNHFRALTVLNEIDRAILSSLNRKKTVATTLQRLKNFFHCEVAVYVRQAEDSEEHLIVYSQEGRRIEDPVVEHFPASREEQLKIFTNKEYFNIHPEEGPTALMTAITGDLPLHFLCLPLDVNHKIQRALLLGFDKDTTLSEDQLTQARKIANQLAIGLANSLLVEDLASLAKGTIAALARTVDAKSKWTSGHSERVAEWSVKIAEAMRLPQDKIEALGRAGLLHDIGKIGIPLAILDKPEELTDEEYKEIKSHPEVGAQILEPIESYRDIIPIVVQHHEKYDGTGYPAGLKGEDIDLRARIMAVADVWDALVSDRPYREGWVSTRAKDLIMKGKGKHFDPYVVEVFMSLLAEA